MPETPLGNGRSQNAVEGPTQGVFDKIVLLLVSGLAKSSVEEAVGKLGLTGDAASSAMAEARMRIQIAARWEHDEQLGTALVRLNDIYRRALAVQDAKTALAVQKELNRLLDLYRSPRETKKAAVDRPSPDAAALAEITAAREYLTPLGLGNEETPLSELCRRAVLRMIKDGHQRILSPTSRAGRGPTGNPSPARPRHRPDSAD